MCIFFVSPDQIWPNGICRCMLVLTQESIWKICIKISKNIVYFYQFALIRWCIQKLTLIYRAHDSMQRVSVCQILSKLLVLWISLVLLNQGDETIFFHFSVHTTDTFPKMWDIYIWNLVDICLDPKGLLVHEAKSDNIYDQNVFNLKLRSYKCYNFLSAQVKKKIYCNISLYMYYSSIWSVRSKKRTKFVYWYIASPRSHIPIKAAFGHPFMLT